MPNLGTQLYEGQSQAHTWGWRTAQGLKDYSFISNVSLGHNMPNKQDALLEENGVRSR